MEGSPGLADDHDSATAADCLRDGGVLPPTGRLVLDREIDGDSIVPALSCNAGATTCQSRALPPPPWMSANAATAATLPEVGVSVPRSYGAATAKVFATS